MATIEKTRLLSYSQFTLVEVVSRFSLTEKSERLFENTTRLVPSDWLKMTLAIGQDASVKSEKARSERVVTPILLEIKERNKNRLSVYSGERLDVDKKHGLAGECDFIISAAPVTVSIQHPIITLVEAKKNDIELGLGQCAAQMLGARLFNQQKGSPAEDIYGCVSTGDVWQFLKLEGQSLIIDSDRYFIDDVDEILGIFQKIIERF